MLVKISIIVPCFNHAQYLDECLESVLGQTFQDWECIIVNDGSSDNTEEGAKVWLEKDNRFKYVKKENGGLSSARNAGIILAKGEFILPLDADDKISINFLEECYKVIQKDASINLIHGKLTKFGAVNRVYKNEPFVYENLLNNNLFSCTSLFRKTEAQNINLYDENLKLGLEDWDFWIRLLDHSSNVVYIDRCSFFYRIKANSMYDLIKKNSTEFLKIKEYIFYKNLQKYNSKSQFELYFENELLTKKCNQSEIYWSYKTLVQVFIKKIKRTLKKKLSK